MKSMRATWSAILFLCTTCVVWAGSVICSDCGYENTDRAARCIHCGVALAVPPSPSPRFPATSPDPESDVAAGGRVDVEIVADEVRAAKRLLKRGDDLVACRVARNALALNMLTDSEDVHRRASAITDLLRECERAYSPRQRTCPTCRGSGHGVMRSENLRGETVRQVVAGKACTRCGGSGRIRGRETMDERKLRLSEAAQRYRVFQQGRQRIEVGSVWGPMGFSEELTVKQRVMMKKSVVATCAGCMGLMRQDCTHCKGTGRDECSNRDCRGGSIMAERDGLGGSSLRLQKKDCPICKGDAKTMCRECRGDGSVLCDECGGTGVPELCRRCNGVGYSECRRCKGAGTYRDDVCTTCNGEMVCECSTCGGSGRRSK